MTMKVIEHINNLFNQQCLLIVLKLGFLLINQVVKTASLHILHDDA